MTLEEVIEKAWQDWTKSTWTGLNLHQVIANDVRKAGYVRIEPCVSCGATDYCMVTKNFISESNKIEGINRNPTELEIQEYSRFMALDRLVFGDCDTFVSVYQPSAVVRSKAGMDVRVGDCYPPRGGQHIFTALLKLLEELGDNSPYQNHLAFESLHPFTDCNGRLGRMIWMWQMREAPRGFLHEWYYQSLEASR